MTLPNGSRNVAVMMRFIPQAVAVHDAMLPSPFLPNRPEHFYSRGPKRANLTTA